MMMTGDVARPARHTKGCDQSLAYCFGESEKDGMHEVQVLKRSGFGQTCVSPQVKRLKPLVAALELWYVTVLIFLPSLNS